MRAVPGRGLGAFFEGFAAPVQGLAFLGKYPKLWRYAWVPVLLNAGITLLLFVSMLYGLKHVSTWMESWFAGAWRYLVFVLDVILLALVLAAAAAAAILLGTLLCSVFYTRLAAKVELMLGTPASELKGVSVLSETIDTVLAMLELALVSLAGAVLPLVPVAGAALSVMVIWYFDSFILGMKYFEFPLSLRGMRRHQIRAFARAHRLHTLGLGSAVFLFTLVPVIGSLALCTAVVGATLLEMRVRRTDS